MSVIPILNQGASEERAENARMSNFVGAIAIKDLVKSTLGPKGMDKILQSTTNMKEVTITNDGATILKHVAADNAAAKILINVSMTQDSDVGDGTTSVVVLCGELLAEAEKLVDKKHHPQTIVMGYRLAQRVAQEALNKAAHDNYEDKKKFQEDLLNMAKTTLSSKILSQDRDKFAEIAVNAILRQGDHVDISQIGFIKKVGGSLNQSFLDDGYILPKSIGVGQPRRIENAKILIANTAMDADKVKIYGAKVKTNDITNVVQLELAEKEKMKRKVERICSSGCTVFINRLLIYNYPEQLFTERGVLSIEHAEFEGIERLALVTGAEIISDFREAGDGAGYKLGSCKLIEEFMIGEDNVIRFSGLPSTGASTIVLRGANKHVLDEAERSLHDALCVLQQAVKNHKVVYGGGCAEILMAAAVEEAAKENDTKQRDAIYAFASALRQLPTILADNAGYDSQDLISKLSAAHYKWRKEHSSNDKEGCDLGLDLDSGCVASMTTRGVVEPVTVKAGVLNSASEAAEMILRIDNILTSAPRQRTE